MQSVGHDRTERDKARHEWWQKEFARESGYEWTEDVGRELRRRVIEVKRDADDDSAALELWQEFVSLLDQMEVVAARSKPSPDAVKLPQPNVAWVSYFVETFPPADLEAGVRRDEDGYVVRGPPSGLAPQETSRLNEKETDPISRTALIRAMSGIMDRLSWVIA